MNQADKPLPSYDFKQGAVLLVDKPKEWTSFDVVNKIRFALKKATGEKKIKVGHAGTLDPLATGLLIICTGKMTKQIDEFQALEKQYTGTFKLGATTPSYDAETEVDATYPIENIDNQLLEVAKENFIGAIQQYPPIFSAIKVNGQPLYKKARQGEIVEVEARSVHIYDFELTNVDLPNVDFRVRCSKGTYIRSLAHDFGKVLNNGAYLIDLRRTHIGAYAVKDAWNMEQLIDFINANASK